MSSHSSRPNRAILVLGMHRSGTSALTRVLNLLGVDLGSRVLPPVPGDNDAGFWEHRDAFDIDERLLAGLGRSWHDVRELPAGWLESPAATHALDEIKQLVENEFGASPLWAVKDPRMCRLAPIWLRALADSGVETHVLFVVRHPVEVAASLRARNGWALAHSLLLWIQHLVEAEHATRECSRVMVTYQQTLEDWSATLTRVSCGLDVPWPRQIDEARTDIEAFLDAGARHQRVPVSPDDGGTDAVPALVGELFDACLELSVEGGTWGALQARASHFRRMAGLYGACIEDFVEYTEAAGAHAQRTETSQLLAALRQDVERITQALASQGNSVAAIERGLARLEQQQGIRARLRRWLSRSRGA